MGMRFFLNMNARFRSVLTHSASAGEEWRRKRGGVEEGKEDEGKE